MDLNIILSPAFFYGLLAFLLILGLISVFSWQNHDKKLSRSKKEEGKNYQAHLENLEAIWSKKERSYNEKAGLLEDLLRAKSDELKNSLSSADNLSKEHNRLKASLLQSQAQLNQKEELLQKTDELKKELSLSNQMYEGLKGQYDELEEKFSQLFQQFLEEQKKQKSAVNRLSIPPLNQPEEDRRSLGE